MDMKSSRRYALLLISLECLSACFNLLPVVGAIVGGESASDGEFPHMAALGRRCTASSAAGSGCGDDGYEWFCGGSLIAARFVLTAGHCAHVGMPQPPEVVRLGAGDLRQAPRPGQDFAVRTIVQHPDYGRFLSYNDIALVELAAPATNIQPACLWTGQPIPADVPLVASGWGKLGHFEAPSPVLQRVRIPIIPNDGCNQLLYRSRRMRYGVLPSQLCAGELAGGKDTCEGDSGGPLQLAVQPTSTIGRSCRYFVVGITSHGGVCGSANRPGLYTRVSYYIGWIGQVLGGGGVH
uniref:Peptidase S1 domain-containing protein n=1 Tax=Anopheles dirus TaxID=7168 RepID=A0A182N745_9DIPT